MSLPNDDENDNWGRQPPHFGKGDPGDFYKDNRILMSPSSEDNATAAETSVGSSSVVSGMSSVAPGDHHAVDTPAPAAPPQTPRTNSAVATLPSQHLHLSSQQQPSMSTVISQRDRYLRQLRQLGLASGATFALTILVLIPPAVLAASMIFCLVMVMFFYKLYQMLQWEYQLIVQGRGIGDYLPSTIYEQLTRTTVHDFMSDTRNSYVNENAYLMLYMIPGLSPEQINEYVGRLSPRHQALLHRHGLGYILGNSFMRLVMGDERLNAPRIEQLDEDGAAATNGSTDSPSSSLSNGSSNSGAGHHNIVPRRLELPPTIPEGASEDSESATSELGHEEDPAAQFARHWGMEVEPQNARPSTQTTRRRSAPLLNVSSTVVAISSQRAASLTQDAQSSSRQQQQQQQQSQDAQFTTSSEARAAEAEAEEQVLYDAIGSAITTYMGVAANMVQSSARRSATLFSGTLFRASMGMTLFGVGIGVYGFWTGTYNPQTFFQPAWQMIQGQVGALLRPPRRLEMPQSQDLIAATAFSGATAGIMLLFQLGNAREDDNKKSPACSKHGSDKGKSVVPSKKQS